MNRTVRAKASYITVEGHKRLSDELSYLWRVKRPEVTRAVAEAAAMGDRSENAEYIYGKKQLRQLDSRIRFLSRRLGELTVVSRTPDDTSTVYFGAWVDIEDMDGRVFKYRIVGPDESDADRGYISVDSPMARALMRKTEGDEVTVSRPNGKAVFVIKGIHYTE